MKLNVCVMNRVGISQFYCYIFSIYQKDKTSSVLASLTRLLQYDE